MDENLKKKITKHLNATNLTVNEEKTKIMEYMTKQKKPKLREYPPQLEVKDKGGNVKTLKTGKYCRILGANLQVNLSWRDHLETGEKSVLPAVRQKLGALYMLGRQLSRKSRLLLANGILQSKIAYLMPIWAGAPKYLMRKLQAVQNRAARFVTGLGRKTKPQCYCRNATGCVCKTKQTTMLWLFSGKFATREHQVIWQKSSSWMET